MPPRGRGRQPVCGQAKGRAVPRQAQGAPLCGKGPAPRHRPRGGVRRRARPCIWESPRASRGCAEKPLPHPAHLQISPHVSRPACYGGLFILRLLRRGNPFRPTAGRFMGRGLLPVRSRRKEPAPLCAGKPPRQPGLCRKALASSGTSYRQAPMSAARPAMGAFSSSTF